jgi:hypothetical protein
LYTVLTTKCAKGHRFVVFNTISIATDAAVVANVAGGRALPDLLPLFQQLTSLGSFTAVAMATRGQRGGSFDGVALRRA